MSQLQVNDTGSLVGSIKGRGDLYATIRPTPGGFEIRIDDGDRPEFWAELTINLETLQRELMLATESEGPHCGQCGRQTTMPQDDYCGDCTPW